MLLKDAIVISDVDFFDHFLGELKKGRALDTVQKTLVASTIAYFGKLFLERGASLALLRTMNADVIDHLADLKARELLREVVLTEFNVDEPKADKTVNVKLWANKNEQTLTIFATCDAESQIAQCCWTAEKPMTAETFSTGDLP